MSSPVSSPVARLMARRLLASLPLVFGVLLIVFVLFQVVGGDPALQMAGKYATPEALAELRARYGWDLPIWKQFFRYLAQIATLELGDSYATRRPILEMIQDGIGPSLSLALPAFLATTVTSIGLALWVAYYRGRWIDRAVVVLSVFGMSVSMLAYVLFGQYFLAYRMGWFPISGYETHGLERVEYLLLPAIIWLVVSLGSALRYYRTAILEEVAQDYVRTARAKGLTERVIYLKHVLRNSLVPIITNVVVEVPLLVLGSFLLETFFSIPGLGSMTIEALNASDLPVVQAMTLMISLLVIVGNLATDLLYIWADPRVRVA